MNKYRKGDIVGIQISRTDWIITHVIEGVKGNLILASNKMYFDNNLVILGKIPNIENVTKKHISEIKIKDVFVETYLGRKLISAIELMFNIDENESIYKLHHLDMNKILKIKNVGEGILGYYYEKMEDYLL